MRSPEPVPSGPLSESYPAAVALVLLALTPFLVLTSASFSLADLISKDVGLSAAGMETTTAMANAAYCFGTVAAVQMTQRLPARRVLVLSATLFLLASVAAAWAPTAALFVIGHVLQGLATSLMLIAAAPPLVTGWPKPRLRPTAVTMNLGIFGAVALGPVVGGLFAGAETWRPLFWIVAGLGAAALTMIVLTYEDAPPQDRETPVDVVAMVLAAGGCGAAFLGASELSQHSFTAPVALVPLLAGVALVALLLVHQYFAPDPLMPVRRLAHTIPVGAILIAICAGAASVGAVELTQSALQLAKVSPAHAGVLFLPELGGAILAAAAFGALIFTRRVPAFALSGLLLLGIGALVLTGVVGAPDGLVLAGTALVGIGVGGSVSPALFSAGFSLPSPQLPRIFALVELLRGVAAFLAGPLLIHVAATAAGGEAAGIGTGIWIAAGIAFGGLLLALAVFASGGARLHKPDIETWLEGEGPALRSPPLGAALADRGSG